MLSKLRILFWIGIILLFLPYLGIPLGAKKVLIVLVGMVIIVLVVKLRHGYKKLKFQLRRVEETVEQPQSVIHG